MLWERAADVFIEQRLPHVCWAIGIADGYESKEFWRSPAVQKFQHDFAALEQGAEALQSGDMFIAGGNHVQGYRDFSLMLLAMAAAMYGEDDVRPIEGVCAHSEGTGADLHAA